MLKLEEVRYFEEFVEGADLDTTKYLLSPDTLIVLKKLMVQSLKQKAEINSLHYISNPQELVATSVRADIEIATYQYLIDLHTTNLENINASS